jgi:hypothetical protein
MSVDVASDLVSRGAGLWAGYRINVVFELAGNIHTLYHGALNLQKRMRGLGH